MRSTPATAFSSENPEFAAHACAAGGHRVRRARCPRPCALLGNKVSARKLAARAGVAVMPATAAAAGGRRRSAARLAAAVGYPVMLKASWGGGGRGMRVVESDAQLSRGAAARAARGARRLRQRRGVPGEAGAPRAPRRGADPRRLARQPRAPVSSATARVQRRNQKVVERAPAVFLSRGAARASCARRRSRSAARRTTATPARSSSCRTPTAGASTSSR